MNTNFMKDHTDLLNYIAGKIGAEVYVEIGVFNPAHNYDRVLVKHKIGVDPDPSAGADLRWTSDKFFDFYQATASTKVDLVWIDGLHHEEQVVRDIRGAFAITRPGGVIALHDCNPYKESITHVPRDSREWTGDVYRAFSRVENEKFTLDFDYGCGIIRKTDNDIKINNKTISWDLFAANRGQLLNLVSLDQGLKIIDTWQQTPEFIVS